jgi:hypothetical protein
VVAVEVAKKGQCTLTVGHLAALAGVSETTVRNALRAAEALQLISIDRRRRTAWVSYPNTLKVVSKEWASWLRLGTGANSCSPRSESKKRKRPRADAREHESWAAGSSYRPFLETTEPSGTRRRAIGIAGAVLVSAELGS